MKLSLVRNFFILLLCGLVIYLLIRSEENDNYADMSDRRTDSLRNEIESLQSDYAKLQDRYDSLLLKHMGQSDTL